MKILVVKLRAIGDTVIWTANLAALRERHPEAEIHALTYPANVAVLMGNPAVDRIHTVQPKSKRALIRALWNLRGEKFDWFLGFHATTSLCRWAWLTGARATVLHHHSWRRTPRGSRPVPHAGDLEDTITRDQRVLEAMGFAPQRQPTRIYLTEDESVWARGQLPPSGKPRYMFLPGASHHLRRYPKDLWLPLVEKVKREDVYEPVVLCDGALSAEWNLREECAKLGVELFDRHGLREFFALIAQGERALANDSGPGHAAVALGLGTSFIFGPGCVGDWHCYDAKIHPVFRTNVDCRLEGPRDRERFQFCVVDRCSHHSCLRKLKIPARI